MSEARPLRFGHYTLDPVEGLMRGRRRLHVTRQSLRVLHLLASRAGRVVTKEEVFRHAWPGIAVTDAALTSCIQELRRALEDDARQPTYIETVHRRGFRFLKPTRIEPDDALASAVPRAAAASALASSGPVVGRDEPLAILERALRHAGQGHRRCVLVVGEPGIGKTTLVEAFLGRQGGTAGLHVARGDAVERLGVSEPYHPLLEALARLCRGPRGEAFIPLLRQYAPAWLAELPALQSPSERRALQRQTAGATRGRLLRELNDAIESVASDATLVLWLEDAHWADASTLDWLSACTRRREPARLLLVVTARPGISARVDALCARLRHEPCADVVPLGGLDENAIREILKTRCGNDAPWQAALARQLHARTEGHPFFTHVLLDELEPRGLLADEQGGEQGVAGRARPAHREALLHAVPDSLRQLIERQVEGLSLDEQQLLEAASIVDEPTWSAALAAACAGVGIVEAEAVLAGLARRGAFLREEGKAEWPDGTVAAAFSFVHVLYRDALRGRLSAARRVELNRVAAARLEAAFGAAPEQAAAQLAVHFEEGRRFDRAARCLQAAANTASRRGAGEEARLSLERALALLRELPASPERDEREAELQVLLGSVVMASDGWAAPAAEAAFDRARMLCDRLRKTVQLFPSYWGVWLYRWGRGDLAAARDLAATLGTLARSSERPALRLQMHHAHWATAFSLGELDVSIAHADAGFALCEGDNGDEHASVYGNHDAGVCSRAFAARALAAQGRLEAAARAGETAVARARQIGHPFSLALALVFSAAARQAMGDAPGCADEASEAAALAFRHGYRLLQAWAEALDAWARGVLGSPRRVLPALRRAVDAAFETGSRQFQTFLLGLVAETSLRASDVTEGLAAVDRALALADETGERFFEAELQRVRAGLLRRAPGGDCDDRVMASLEGALAAARHQGAALFALRAALELGDAMGAAGNVQEGRERVRQALAALPPGSSSAEIDSARLFVSGG